MTARSFNAQTGVNILLFGRLLGIVCKAWNLQYTGTECDFGLQFLRVAEPLALLRA